MIFVKNKIIKTVSYGFVSGFCVGCFPNKLCIKIEDKKYKSLPIPLLSGVICSLGLMFPSLLILSITSKNEN